jgi:hypothetical protein
MKTEMWRRAAMAAAVICACASPAAAQQEDVASWNFPGWSFTPGVSLAGVWDSNVGLADAPAATQRTDSDRLFMIQPFGRLEYLSPRTTFATGYRGNLRRYMEVDQLNGFDQRVDASIRRLVTRRLTLFLSDNFADVPSTDETELNGVPFSRTGTRTNTLNAGGEYRLTQYTDLAVRYENTWVTFDRNAETFLAGGVVNGVRTELSHRMNERVALGGEYSLRLADLNEGTRQLTFHDAGGTFRYVAGPRTTVSAAAGVSYLEDKTEAVTRTAPGFMPALSAGSPFSRARAIGRTSGVTPIAPASHRPSLVDCTSNSSVRASRSTVIGTARLGRIFTASSAASHVAVRSPPTVRMRSPARMPARSAGLPASTAATTAGCARYAGISAPCASTMASTTTASTMFITGPMIRTWNRSHLVFERNSSGAPDRGSSGLSPAIFT